MNPLQNFEEFFKSVFNDDYLSHRTYDYNGQRVFVFSPDGSVYRRFSIAFDIKSGQMVWEDIEIWE